MRVAIRAVSYRVVSCRVVSCHLLTPIFTLGLSFPLAHSLRTGISRGMANVTFDVQGDAVKALNKSSYYIDDRMVYCEWSKPREPRH